MVSDDSADWPEEWRMLHDFVEGKPWMRSRADRRVRRAIGRAAKRERLVEGFRYAAAVFLVLGTLLGAVLVKTERMRELSLVSHPWRGSAVVLRVGRSDGEWSLLHKGLSAAKIGRARVRSGSVFWLPQGSWTDLKTDGGMALRIEGPALAEVGLAGGEVDFFLEYGTIWVRSYAAKREAMVWRTANFVYRMRGTVARLEVEAGGEKLTVLEGEFSVSDAKTGSREEGVSVKTGESLTLRAGKPLNRSKARLASEGERVELLATAKDMDAPAAGRGKPPEAKPGRGKYPVLATEEAIREHYGAVQEILLRDGRLLVGYLIVDAKGTRIHTTKGVLRVRRGEIENVSIVR